MVDFTQRRTHLHVDGSLYDTLYSFKSVWSYFCSGAGGSPLIAGKLI